MQDMSLGRPVRSHRLGWMALMVAAVSLLPAGRADAGVPRWMLIYYRQVGNNESANNRTIENHLFFEDGGKAAGIGVTNLSNSGSAIFGFTDVNGYNRINPLDLNNCAYDIRTYDPSTPTEQSPTFYFQNPTPTLPRHYSYITHWMKVSDDARVVTYPQIPVYHYDLVNGLNQVSGLNLSTCIADTFTEPSGAWSDAKTLTSWSTYQAQTFVVPAGINRIVSAQAFLTRQGGVHFTYLASIRQGGPTGTQIGPTAVSRDVVSVEFKEVAVSWGLQDVPVTPGQTYALRLEAQDGGGFNVYGTTADNYANGSLYNGSVNLPGQDMIAVVVGVGYDTTPPEIDRQPASFTHTIGKGDELASDLFTIANSGSGTLSYSINDNASWLSVDPDSGTATTETDDITILYDTASLSLGGHVGTITIDAPSASNTPQFVTVNLTVTTPQFAKADHDEDGDVDLADYGWFQTCFTGEGVVQDDADCSKAKLDSDDDVDNTDLTKFMQCLNGDRVIVDTLCHE